MWIVPDATNGADVFLEGDCADEASATQIADDLTEVLRRQNAGFDEQTVNSVDALVDKKAYPFLPTLRGQLLFSGVKGAPVRPAAIDWNNIQPRIGFAWQAKIARDQRDLAERIAATSGRL